MKYAVENGDAKTRSFAGTGRLLQRLTSPLLLEMYVKAT